MYAPQCEQKFLYKTYNYLRKQYNGIRKLIK